METPNCYLTNREIGFVKTTKIELNGNKTFT